MSHVAHIDLHIKDLQALNMACAKMGLALIFNQKTFKWFGEWVDDYNTREAAVTQGFDPKTFGECEHTIKVNNASADTYEVGLVKRLDNKPGYTCLYDNFCAGHGLEKVIGEGAGLLKQGYAVEVARRQAQKQGFRVQEVVRKDGTVMLNCTK